MSGHGLHGDYTYRGLKQDNTCTENIFWAMREMISLKEGWLYGSVKSAKCVSETGSFLKRSVGHCVWLHGHCTVGQPLRLPTWHGQAEPEKVAGTVLFCRNCSIDGLLVHSDFYQNVSQCSGGSRGLGGLTPRFFCLSVWKFPRTCLFGDPRPPPGVFIVFLPDPLPLQEFLGPPLQYLVFDI